MNYNKINKPAAYVGESPNSKHFQETVNQKTQEQIKEEPKNQMPEKEILTGIVFSKSKLNIRKSFDIDSEIVCTVDPGDELSIDERIEDWCHVCTTKGVVGFAMSKYIQIKE